MFLITVPPVPESTKKGAWQIEDTQWSFVYLLNEWIWEGSDVVGIFFLSASVHTTTL